MADNRRRRRTREEPWERPRSAASRAKRPRQPRQSKQHTGVWLRLLTMLLIVAVFILGVAIFFKVRTVTITGNGLYGTEEIVVASGIEEGDNLMTLSKAAAAGKIMALLPYIEEVRIGKSLPDTVTIDVKESDASFAILDDAGGRWLISAGCKVLAQAPASAAEYPQLVGITAVSPVVGQPLQSEQEDVLAATKILLEELEKTDFIPQLVELDVTKAFDIVLTYTDRFEIRLGGSDEMAYKLQYLTEVLSQLDEGQSGVIDLTLQEDRVARLRPW